MRRSMTDQATTDKIHTMIARSRCAGGVMSAMVPPSTVTGAEVMRRAEKRKPMSIFILYETTQETLKMMKPLKTDTVTQ